MKKILRFLRLPSCKKCRIAAQSSRLPSNLKRFVEEDLPPQGRYPQCRLQILPKQPTQLPSPHLQRLLLHEVGHYRPLNTFERSRGIRVTYKAFVLHISFFFSLFFGKTPVSFIFSFFGRFSCFLSFVPRRALYSQVSCTSFCYLASGVYISSPHILMSIQPIAHKESSNLVLCVFVSFHSFIILLYGLLSVTRIKIT